MVPPTEAAGAPWGPAPRAEPPGPPPRLVVGRRQGRTAAPPPERSPSPPPERSPPRRPRGRAAPDEGPGPIVAAPARGKRRQGPLSEPLKRSQTLRPPAAESPQLLTSGLPAADVRLPTGRKHRFGPGAALVPCSPPVTLRAAPRVLPLARPLLAGPVRGKGPRPRNAEPGRPCGPGVGRVPGRAGHRSPGAARRLRRPTPATAVPAPPDAFAARRLLLRWWCAPPDVRGCPDVCGAPAHGAPAPAVHGAPAPSVPRRYSATVRAQLFHGGCLGAGPRTRTAGPV